MSMGKIVLLLWLVLFLALASAQEDPRDGVITREPIPESMFPLTDEPATLRVAAVWAGAGDPKQNEFTKYYEELTGVKVEWEVLSEAEGRQTLNLMLASGNYPDIIMGFWDTTPAQLQTYGQQGVYLRLNDLIEEHGPDIKKIYDQYPEAWDVSADTEGDIYGLTEVNDCFHCSMANKLWLYKPWLDKLGLEVPTTLEAYYEVLKAFKTQDPNGNGKADEIPLTTAVDAWVGALDPYFMSPFIVNPDTRLILNEGSVQVTFSTPEWREGLLYLKRLHDEGLLDPNSFTQDAEQLTRLGNAEVPIVGSITTGGTHWLSEYVPEKGARWSQYVVVPPLEGPTGQRVQPSSPYSSLIPGRFIITTVAKDPELAMRWANSFFQQEVELSAYFGAEGEGWRWAEEGEKGMSGNQALYAPIESAPKTRLKMQEAGARRIRVGARATSDLGKCLQIPGISAFTTAKRPSSSPSNRTPRPSCRPSTSPKVSLQNSPTSRFHSTATSTRCSPVSLTATLIWRRAGRNTWRH